MADALTLVDLEVEFPRSQETEIIVPAKAVTEIQRLVREEGEVKLSIGQNQIGFELNNPARFQADRRELPQLSPSDSF